MSATPFRDRATAALIGALRQSLNDEIVARVTARFPDVRPAHGNVLGSLVHEDGLRASDLATLAGMTKQSMGALVDDLEQKGYVERRSDPEDRRSKRVYLTERGRGAVQVSGVAVRSQEQRLSRALGPEGHARLRELLLTLLEEYR